MCFSLSLSLKRYHKQELTISKEVNDRSSEASTHGNLAVAYQVTDFSCFSFIFKNKEFSLYS